MERGTSKILSDMKHNLLLTAMLTVFATSFAVADNGILTPLSFGGDDLSLVAYCQNGEDYLVECIRATAPDFNTSPGASSYNIYNSSWQKIHSITDFLRSTAFLNSAHHAYEGADESFLFSQTLLNDDAEFEYMVEKNRLVDTGGYAYYQPYGFKIMQTNGNCLADITYPEGTNMETPQFILLKDKLYLSVYCGSGGSYSLKLYEVNREVNSNVLKLVSESKVSAGYPNPVKQGEVYTVARGKYSMKNAVVNVVRLDGSLVQSFSTGDNENVEIETSQMNGGVYVYTVIRGNKVIASGRLVVE